jgi:hypothetical protein
MKEQERTDNDAAAEADTTDGGVGDVETAGETTAAVAITGPTNTKAVGADTMVKVADSSDSTKSAETESQ